MGTSGVVFVHSPKYVTDPAGRVQTFCSAVAGESKVEQGHQYDLPTLDPGACIETPNALQ